MMRFTNNGLAGRPPCGAIPREVAGPRTRPSQNRRVVIEAIEKAERAASAFKRAAAAQRVPHRYILPMIEALNGVERAARHLKRIVPEHFPVNDRTSRTIRAALNALAFSLQEVAMRFHRVFGPRG